jgi:hypothetical protein
MIDEIGDVPQPRLAHREIGREIGEQELYALELDDAPARLAALVDVRDRIAERGAGDAERVRRDARARFVERGEEEGEAVAGVPFSMMIAEIDLRPLLSEELASISDHLPNTR